MLALLLTDGDSYVRPGAILSSISVSFRSRRGAPVKPSRHQLNVDAQVSSVASLGEPMRRRLYRYVVSQPEPVSREQAAAGIDVAHHIAKFHLDKLEED